MPATISGATLSGGSQIYFPPSALDLAITVITVRK